MTFPVLKQSPAYYLVGLNSYMTNSSYENALDRVLEAAGRVGMILRFSPIEISTVVECKQRYDRSVTKTTRKWLVVFEMLPQEDAAEEKTAAP